MAARAEEFEGQRSRLFSIAYRMLGSASDAEDVVQEAFVRYERARAQRERYVGPWPPEPVLTTDGTLGPLETAEQRDLVSLAFLLLLERLSPRERAVFVLREAFAYEHREVAEILGATEATCRQLHRRARQHLAERQPRFGSSPQRQRLLVERFVAAAQDGDLQGLEAVLIEDATIWSDGGGTVTAARRPVVGRAPVARLAVGVAAQGARAPQAAMAFGEVNGQPAVLAWTGGLLQGTFVFDVAGERISAIRAILNPGKLAYLRRQLGTTAPAPIPWR